MPADVSVFMFLSVNTPITEKAQAQCEDSSE